LILLVDDNCSVLYTSKALLEAYGYQVAAYFSPVDALQHLKEKRDTFSTLLTGFDMPMMNGLDLIQAAQMEQANIRCILYSGCPPNHIPDDVILLLKPAPLKQLLDVIEEATSLV